MFWKNKREQKKIFVGLSGGVDSSVSLALLQKDGYDVSGVYIKSWVPDWISCDWKEDRRDAMRVCAHLGVPFYELDLSDLYKREVINMMIAEYRAGRTPNPDVVCNRAVKFGAFWDWAKQNGADYIATGHYARILKCHSRECGNPAEIKSLTGSDNTLLDPRIREDDNNYDLIRGIDPTKDQSYFLWTLTQDDLSHVIFPIGHLKKTAVRGLARKFDLPVSEKKDSQGICLLGNIDLREFLSHYIPQKSGDILNINGEAIGIHPGMTFFTIGERHGFTITKKTSDDRPYYIVAKDIANNTLTVSEHLEALSEAEETKNLVSMNQIIPWENDGLYEAQVRYHGQKYKVQVSSLSSDKKTATVAFLDNAPLVAAGQSVVLYRESVCYGGGVIS